MYASEYRLVARKRTLFGSTIAGPQQGRVKRDGIRCSNSSVCFYGCRMAHKFGSSPGMLCTECGWRDRDFFVSGGEKGQNIVGCDMILEPL